MKSIAFAGTLLMAGILSQCGETLWYAGIAIGLAIVLPVFLKG